jgi:signal transduction histidine kinase
MSTTSTQQALEVEQQRVDSLYSYHLIDGVGNDQFDSLVKLASTVCETPIATLNLLDEDTEYTISSYGVELHSLPRKESICNHIIANPVPLVVEDISQDERFTNKSSFINNNGLKFFAGFPLVNTEGYAIGAICVYDSDPKKMTSDQLTALETIANQILLLFNSHKHISELEQKQDTLQQNIDNLEEYTGFISNDLRSPFRNIELISEILYDKHITDLPQDSLDHLKDIVTETKESREFIVDLLEYSKSISAFNQEFELVSMDELIHKLVAKMKIPEKFTVEIEGEMPEFYFPRMALNHLFSNLIENATKYNDAEEPIIRITYMESYGHHIFKVYDNGPGINPKIKPIINKLFEGGLDSNSNFIKSIGLGLAIVNKLAHLMGGGIILDSEPGKGCEYTFGLPINAIDDND